MGGARLDSDLKRRRLAVILCSLVAGVFTACAPARFYPGPPRPTEELVVIVAKAPSKISSIDGQPVSVRRAEILPGRHSLEFSGQFGELLEAAGVTVGESRPRPLLKTSCVIEIESMAAGLFTYDANAVIDQKSSGPDSSYRWQKTSVDPRLVDAGGDEIAGMACDETCRLRGRKGRSNVSRACEIEN